MSVKHVPCEGVAVENVRPTGKESMSATSTAGDVVLGLVTVKVKLAC
jgi:hypothetical protein